jgi:TonB-dependent starch-binding outer membrane protein SusC
MRKVLLLGLMLFLGSAIAFAQSRVITGTVKSNEDGLPVPGASVTVKGTMIGVATDLDGRYSLQVPEGSRVLVFSFVGLLTQEQTIGTRTKIDVTLESDITSLSEVIITGYGSTPKREVTGSIASVKGEAIENMPVQSFDRALQGRAAGVQVTATSGAPGGGINVRVRGVGSINAGSEPLYIIDGVQVASGGLGSQASNNLLNSINPNDIQSIEVLKDAATAAIYGAQAANGVVIITTKKGKAGKTQFNLSVQDGTVEAIRTIPTMDAAELATMKIEAFQNRFLRLGPSSTNGTTLDAARQLAVNIYGDPTTVQSTDWQDAVYRTGRSRTVDFSANGGDDKTKFYLSTSYNLNEGQVIKSDFERGTVRLNLDHKANDKLSFDVNMSLATTTQNGAIADGAFINSPFFAALFTLPNQPIYKEDGTFNAPLPGTFGYNLVQSVEFETRRLVRNQTVSSFAANYKINKKLRWRSFFGVDYAFARDDNYRDARVPQFAATGGSAFVSGRTLLNWNTNHTLTYSNTFNNVHSLNVLGGTEFRVEENEEFTASGQGFPNGLFRSLQNAAVPSAVSGFYTTWKVGSFFANAKYDYKDKYLVSGTARYDGSSRFGANNRWGLFYSTALAYRISSEDFMKDLTWIDDLKIRASYGVTGNSSIGNFASRALFGGGGNYVGLPGIRPSQLGNDDLSWERAETINLGLDFAIFESRIFGSVEVYDRKNKDLLLNAALPNDSGFGSITTNIGKVQNQGLEIELNTVNVDKGGFKWSTSFNVSFQRNEILALDGRETIGNTLRVGFPVSIYWYAEYAGVNPADGRAMYYDTLNNITYAPQARDSRFVGSPLPKGFGGLTNTFSYKGLTLEVFFQGQWGNMNLNNTAFFHEAAGGAGWNQAKSQLRRWQQPGDITDVPKAYEGVEPGVTGSRANAFTTRQMEDASYIRLKQVTLGYNLPSTLAARMNLRQVRFFVQGINLATFTAYTGFDPEILATDIGRYPQSKQITGGVTVSF